jgi:hypothetical protein
LQYDHNYKKAYDIRKVGETLELFGKNKKKSENGGKMIALEDMWDRCWEIHRDVGFTGRTAMEAESKKFYDNMTRPVIETFLNYSEEYQVKLSRPDNHGLCITPIRTDRFMARWQIDLVDFRTCPDGEYKWICNVQDHFTKETANQEIDDEDDIDEEEREESDAMKELREIYNKLKTSSQEENIASSQAGIVEHLNNIAQARNKANEGQEKNAKAMLKQSNKKQIMVKINELVLLYVDPVDRAKSSPNNLLCYVVEQKYDKGPCTISIGFRPKLKFEFFSLFSVSLMDLMILGIFFRILSALSTKIFMYRFPCISGLKSKSEEIQRDKK